MEVVPPCTVTHAAVPLAVGRLTTGTRLVQCEVSVTSSLESTALGAQPLPWGLLGLQQFLSPWDRGAGEQGHKGTRT